LPAVLFNGGFVMSEHTSTPEIVENHQMTEAELRAKYDAAKTALKDLASEFTRAAADYAGDVKGRAADWVHGKREVLHERVDHTQAAVLTYVRKNPYKSIAIAAGAGLALGVLLGRSR